MHGNKQNASNSNSDINELVTKHVNNLDDKGKLQLPDDMPDWQKHVIRSEKRQRDAQSELGRTQSQLRESAAVNTVLMEKAGSMIPDNFQLSEDELVEINKLKTTDPEAYRLKVNDLEAKAKIAQSTLLGELTKKAADDATTAHVSKNRITVLADFRDANPDLVITDHVLVNDVPPRYLAGVTDGNYTYEEYLGKVKTYLETGKNVAGDDKGDPHNIHNMTGGHKPGKAAADKAGKSDYAKMTF